MLCEEGGDGVEGGVGGGSQISLTVMELKNTIPKVQEQPLFAEFIAINSWSVVIVVIAKVS